MEKANKDQTVKGNLGSKEPKKKKKVKNIASHGHVTTSTRMCLLLKTLEVYKNVLFHADKSNDLSAHVFCFFSLLLSTKHRGVFRDGECSYEREVHCGTTTCIKNSA